MSKGVSKGAKVARQKQLPAGGAAPGIGNYTGYSNTPSAGMLNRRITFLQLVPQDDQGSGRKDLYTPWKTVWASVIPQKGRDIFLAEQLDEELNYTIKVRYVRGVLPTMRIAYRNRTLLIRQVMDRDESHEMIEIIAQEMQGMGT